MAHIVVLGAGIGGISMAFEAKAAARSEDRVTVISNQPYFQFTPSNPWVGVGWRQRNDIVIDLAPILKRRDIGFISIAATRLHASENTVELSDGSKVEYDYLVIATGPELAFDEIEGLGPDGFTHSVCTVDHAENANIAFEQLCADPGPVVIGAVQGASCFGPAYEYAMMLDTELRKRQIRHKIPMTFVTSEPYIGHLGLDGVGDTKGMLEAEMRDRHIKWVTNAKVDKVEKGKLTYTQVDSDGKDIKTGGVAFKYSMILPAFRGIPAVRDIDGLVNPRGFIIVDKHQRNPKFENIFAVGVCIAIAPAEMTPVPTGIPKTGLMIESMVTATAHNIGDLLRGKAPSSEPTWNALCLADFGDTGVAILAIPQNPPRNLNWMSDGKWVHHAKVAFEKYFLRKVRKGNTDPFYERMMLNLIKVPKLKEKA